MKNMHRDDQDLSQLEQSKYILSLVNSWITNADNKVSISCGIFTGMFGVISFLATQIKEPTVVASINTYYQFFYWATLIIGLIMMIISLQFYVRALNPVIRSSKDEVGQETITNSVPVFFRDIANFDDIDKYIKSFRASNEIGLTDEILKEIFINSKICEKKMRMCKDALWHSLFAVLFAVVSFVAHILMYRI